MAEDTSYEFEVMRAELLGVQPPTREVYEASQSQKERMAAEQEEIETELVKVSNQS